MEDGMENLGREISKLVVGLKYYEWRKICKAIETKYASAQARAEITCSAEDIEQFINSELSL